MTKQTKRQKIIEIKNKIYDAIDASLRSATLVYVHDEDGDGYPLIDFLSHGKDISTGKDEISHIVEQIEIEDEFDELLALPIEVPTEEEIEKQIIECGLSKVPEGQQYWEGAKWAIEEILKRNQ